MLIENEKQNGYGMAISVLVSYPHEYLADLGLWLQQLLSITRENHTCEPLVLVQSLNCVCLFVTPRTVARQAPLSMGFPRQEYWSGSSFPSPGDLPDPGFEPGSPAWQAYSLPPGKQTVAAEKLKI